MRYRYVLITIVVVLFLSNCDCNKDPVDPQHYWVVCVKGDSSFEPALTNGHEFHYAGQLFDPSQWSCPDTGNSPIWNGSGKPLYSTTAVKPSGAPGQRAAAPAPPAFLRVPMLDLPFPAQRNGSEGTSFQDCDPSQPDILQINHDRATVNRIGTCPFRPIATIPVATRPLQVAITPDGLTALVTSFDNAVNFIDLTSNRVTFTLPTPGINPNGIAITQDGATAYVASFVPSGAVVAKIDLASRTIAGTVLVNGYPQNVFLSPDDSQLFVTFPYGNSVSIIDTLTNTVAFGFSVSAPRGIAFNSKGTRAYVASSDAADQAFGPGTVKEFNINTFQVVHSYAVDKGPNDVGVLYGDQFVVVTNYEGGSVSKIDTTTGAVTTVKGTGQLSGLSIVR